jgi:hypothetical protein
MAQKTFEPMTTRRTMSRRELSQVEAERIAREKQEAERLRLQEEAKLIATVDAEAEFAACIAAIKQAEPAVVAGILALFRRLPEWEGPLANGVIRLAIEDGRLCIDDVESPIERLKCSRQYRALMDRWREVGSGVEIDGKATAIANARQLGLLIDFA